MLATLLPLHRAIIQETYSELKITVDRSNNASWISDRTYEPWIDVRPEYDNKNYLVKIRLDQVDSLPVVLEANGREVLNLSFERDNSRFVTIGGAWNKPAHFAIDRSLPDPKHAQKQSWLTRLSSTAHRLSGGLFGREAHSIPKSGIEVGRNPGRDSANEETVKHLSIVCEAITLLHREHFQGSPTP
jgi:hypothetical protein